MSERLKGLLGRLDVLQALVEDATTSEIHIDLDGTCRFRAEGLRVWGTASLDPQDVTELCQSLEAGAFFVEGAQVLELGTMRWLGLKQPISRQSPAIIVHRVRRPRMSAAGLVDSGVISAALLEEIKQMVDRGEGLLLSGPDEMVSADLLGAIVDGLVAGHSVLLQASESFDTEGLALTCLSRRQLPAQGPSKAIFEDLAGRADLLLADALESEEDWRWAVGGLNKGQQRILATAAKDPAAALRCVLMAAGASGDGVNLSEGYNLRALVFLDASGARLCDIPSLPLSPEALLDMDLPPRDLNAAKVDLFKSSSPGSVGGAETHEPLRVKMAPPPPVEGVALEGLVEPKRTGSKTTLPMSLTKDGDVFSSVSVLLPSARPLAKAAVVMKVQKDTAKPAGAESGGVPEAEKSAAPRLSPLPPERSGDEAEALKQEGSVHAEAHPAPSVADLPEKEGSAVEVSLDGGVASRGRPTGRKTLIVPPDADCAEVSASVSVELDRVEPDAATSSVKSRSRSLVKPEEKAHSAAAATARLKRRLGRPPTSGAWNPGDVEKVAFDSETSEESIDRTSEYGLPKVAEKGETTTPSKLGTGTKTGQARQPVQRRILSAAMNRIPRRPTAKGLDSSPANKQSRYPSIERPATFKTKGDSGGLRRSSSSELPVVDEDEIETSQRDTFALKPVAEVGVDVDETTEMSFNKIKDEIDHRLKGD